jgi:hypothetical protein
MRNRATATRHWPAAAAVVTVAATLCLSACGDSAVESTPSEPSSDEVAPVDTASDVMAHAFDLPPFPTIRLTGPTTWNAIDGWLLNHNPCDPTGCTEVNTTAAVSFWRVTEIFAEPCQWSGTLFDPGPSVDDLAVALSGVPTRNASEPVPVTVGGFDGLYVEWTVPDDADFAVCDEGFFESWKSDVGGTDRYQQLPGQVDRVWILDVDGDRLVIDAFYLPATPEVDRRAIDDIVASIEFEGAQ